MSVRRFCLVVALVSIAVTTAMLTLSPTAETDAAAVPTTVLAEPLPPNTVASASAQQATDTPTSTHTDKPGINLALVIAGGERWAAIPQDPDARLAELAAAANVGVPDAADELYLLAERCSPDARIPLPATEQGYEEARERLLQTRTLTTNGPVIGSVNRALVMLEQGYRLCSAFERLNLPGHANWNRIAVEHGSYYAMLMYWKAQRGAGDWEVIQARSIEYLERARDEGYVPAFFNIGLMRGEFAVDGPYSPDHTEALAHFYALIEIGNAMAIGQAGSPQSRRGRMLTRHARTRFVRELEMKVSPYQIQMARERANELLDRCCR